MLRNNIGTEGKMFNNTQKVNIDPQTPIVKFEIWRLERPKNMSLKKRQEILIKDMKKAGYLYLGEDMSNSIFIAKNKEVITIHTKRLKRL